MKLFPSRPTPSPDRSQALACIPRCNDTIHWERCENGDILLSYPLPLNSFFLTLHKRFGKSMGVPPSKKIQLDAMGSFVWTQIDGKKTVKEIIQLFAKKHQLTVQEAEHAVTAFIKTLGQRGLIALH